MRWLTSFNRFRWVYCQLEVLQNCRTKSLRQKLSELPKTLDETYERILREIGKADGDLACRILQCLAVASRPLRVEELSEVLALDFEDVEGRMPKFNKDWQLQDRQQALLITCSCLITIVGDHGSRVVQFSHFSVKEFLTSDRLATPVRDVSSFHILPEPAHAILAQACLAVLLRLDDSIPKDVDQCIFSLAHYAARHWMDHAQFEKVSLCVEDGMRRLFDQSKPYFMGWLKLQDFEPWDPRYEPTTKPDAAPLYYASLYGFRDLAEHLIVKSPQGVNARGGLHHSPLAAALHNRHFDVAELLHQHGADIEFGSYNNWTLLVNGHVDAVRWLLEHGANVNLQQNDGRTSSPEAVGMLRGHTRILNAVIDHGGSPLHLASAAHHDCFKTMQLLIHCGADVTARDNSNSTPLHIVSSRGGPESMKLLIQHGADVNALDKGNSTPLHRVFKVSTETVQLFTQHGADVTAQGSVHWFDFLWVTRAEAVEVLIRYGADVNARDKRNSTPLHRGLPRVSPESVQLFIQHWADIAGQGDNFETLGFTQDAGAKTVEVLIQHGANVNARDKSNWTPLHLVSSRQSGEIESARVLLEHGANAGAEDDIGRTPYEIALSIPGIFSHEVARLILDHRNRTTERI